MLTLRTVSDLFVPSQALSEQRLIDIAKEEEEARWKAFEANLMAGISRQNSNQKR